MDVFVQKKRKLIRYQIRRVYLESIHMYRWHAMFWKVFLQRTLASHNIKTAGFRCEGDNLALLVPGFSFVFKCPHIYHKSNRYAIITHSALLHLVFRISMLTARASFVHLKFGIRARVNALFHRTNIIDIRCCIK